MSMYCTGQQKRKQKQKQKGKQKMRRQKMMGQLQMARRGM